MPTKSYIASRVYELTKSQCGYLLTSLKLIPISAELWNGHIPYFKEDCYSDDFDFVPYDINREYSKKFITIDGSIADYVETKACDKLESFMGRDVFGDSCLKVDRKQLEELLSMREYIAANACVRGYAVPSYADHTSKKWDFWEEGTTYAEFPFMNQSCAFGMEVVTQGFKDFILNCVMPLSVFSPHALSKYGCDRVWPEHTPRLNFVGKGIREIEEIWEELGGSIETHTMPQSFPINFTFRKWILPEETAKAYMKALRDVARIAKNKWPAYYRKWVSRVVRKTVKRHNED